MQPIRFAFAALAVLALALPAGARPAKHGQRPAPGGTDGAPH